MSIIHASTIIIGAAAVAVAELKLSGVSLDTVSTTPAPASCSFSFFRDGHVSYSAQIEPPNPDDEWWTVFPVTDIGDSFEVQLTVSSGDAPTSGPAINTFHALSTTRTWTLATLGLGPQNLDGSYLLEVREIAVPANIVSAGFTCTCAEEGA